MAFLRIFLCNCSRIRKGRVNPQQIPVRFLVCGTSCLLQGVSRGKACHQNRYEILLESGHQFLLLLAVFSGNPQGLLFPLYIDLLSTHRYIGRKKIDFLKRIGGDYCSHSLVQYTFPSVQQSADGLILTILQYSFLRHGLTGFLIIISGGLFIMPVSVLAFALSTKEKALLTANAPKAPLSLSETL